jgi:hypothetical protein
MDARVKAQREADNNRGFEADKLYKKGVAKRASDLHETQLYMKRDDSKKKGGLSPQQKIEMQRRKAKFSPTPGW